MIEYIACQFEGGWTVTVPSAAVVLRAGIFLAALTLLGEVSEPSASASALACLRGDLHVGFVAVVVDVVVIVVAGLSLPRLRFLDTVLNVSSMSSLSILSGPDTSSVSSCWSFSTCGIRLYVKPLSAFAALRVDRRVGLFVVRDWTSRVVS